MNNEFAQNKNSQNYKLYSNINTNSNLKPSIKIFSNSDSDKSTDRKTFRSSKVYDIITGLPIEPKKVLHNPNKNSEDFNKPKNILSKLSSLSTSYKTNSNSNTNTNNTTYKSVINGGGIFNTKSLTSNSKETSIPQNLTISNKNWDRELFHNYTLFDKDKERINSNSSDTNDIRRSLNSREKSNNGNVLVSDTVSNSLNQILTNICSNQIGLENLGNTCFMNSALQCLIHCKPFIRRLYHEKEILSQSIRPTPISKAFINLCNEIFSQISKGVKNKNSISPNEFKTNFGQFHMIFSGYSQHDTQEFTRILLEDISQELNRVVIIPKYKELDTASQSRVKLNSEYSKLFKGREDSIVIDTFYGQIVNTFKCLECAFESYSFEKFLDIPLLLDGDSTFTAIKASELLDNFFSNEKLKWDSPCENNKCKKKSFHLKSIKLGSLPEVLILSFQRYNARLRRKNTSRIEFQECLDLRNCSDLDCLGNINTKYNLFAVCNHSGTMEFGHYYSHVKLNTQGEGDAAWYEFNDSYVSRCYNFSSNSNTVYVLFYIRQDV